MKARHRSTTGFDFKTPKDKENPLYQQEYLDIPESNIKIGTKNDSTQPTKIKALTLKIKHLSFKKKTKQEEDGASPISTPFNVRHNIHVDYDASGYKGLPLQWQAMLKKEEPVNPLHQSQQSLPTEKQVTLPQKHLSTPIPSSHAPWKPGTVPRRSPRRAEQVIIESIEDGTSCTSNTSMDELMLDVDYDDLPPIPDTPDIQEEPWVEDWFEKEWPGEGDPDLIFRDLRRIGEGSSGVVFYGVTRSTCEKSAIKVIYYKSKTETEANILRNMLLTQKTFKHPNIIQYRGSFTREAQLWVVFEYMDGGTVASLIDSVKISELHIAAICREVLKVLVMLHENNKVHQNIKCDNILLSLNGDVKLGDFGSTQLPETVNKPPLMSTPYWVAPEIIKGEPCTPALDIWSLGMALLEMANGEAPYSDLPPLKALYTIASSGSPGLKEEGQWSDAFLDFLKCCTARDPALRSTAKSLQKHPFLRMACPLQQLAPVIRKAKNIRRRLSGTEEVQ